MSYDLTIWKWSAEARVRSIAQVLERLAEDEAHPSLQRFDTVAFRARLIEEFGSQNEDHSPFEFEVCDFTGWHANWIVLNVAFSEVGSVLPRLGLLAKEFGLFVFDHQKDDAALD